MPQRDERVSKPAADNIRAVIRLERQTAEEATRSERISERTTRIIGSLPFVLAHLTGFAAWAGWNAIGPHALRFDPYPYGLLTFLVSMEGVLVATFVLVAQNRMSRQSDQRDHLDLQIDLLTEQELTVMMRLLRRVAGQVGVPPEDEDVREVERLTERTDVDALMRKLKHEL